MRTLKRISIILIALMAFNNHNRLNAADGAGVYGGGPFYYDRHYAIDHMRQSGFKWVCIWTIHVMNSNGDLNFNAEFPLVENGNYIGGNSFPHFASDVTAMKTQPTSVEWIEFGLSGWGSGTFEHIRTIVNTHGTGPGSPLYENFQALKNAFPAVDAISFDDESEYHEPSATQFAVMLADLGFKVSICPYTQASFWQSLVSNTNNQRPGTIEDVHLQCYAGGSGNNPCSWKGYFASNINVMPGVEDEDPIENKMSGWNNQCGITGGWLWLYDDFKNNLSLTQQYASDINNNISGGSPPPPPPPPPADAVATIFQHCDYGGYQGHFEVGNFTLADMNARGVANDDASSIRVDPGYQVTVYQHDNFGGYSWTITADDACLVNNTNGRGDGSNWNDDISSMKVATTGGGGGDPPIGSVIAMKGNNGKYVCSENGSSAMICNRSAIGGWEKFDVVDAGGGKIALKGSNNKYVTNANPMWCNGSSIDNSTTFTWVDRGGNDFALQSTNGKYVCSENGTSPMNCNRTAIGGWETFTMELTTKSAEIITDIDKSQNNSGFRVYPTYAYDVFTIESPGNIITTIDIVDIQGRLVYQNTFTNKININTSDISGSGILFIKLATENNTCIEKLMIK